MVFFMVFHGFFKELDSKELDIHRYSLVDTINEYQWISINEYQWISINEFIDGSLMVPFLWFPFFGPSLGPVGPPLGPNRAQAANKNAAALTCKLLGIWRFPWEQKGSNRGPIG